MSLALLLVLAPLQAFAQLQMTPREAHDHVAAGRAILVDIRTPEEWAETGAPKGALRLDMSQPDFVAKLEAARNANPGKDIALICRSANRSAYVHKALTGRGWTNLIDVKGGVGGNSQTKGWKDLGLPMEK